MRYAVMSDVHANPAALDAALEDSRALGCDRRILLGDMTGYGYDAKSVVDMCRREFDVVLLGNHDAACVGLDAGLEVRLNPHYDIDRMQRGDLSQEQVGWIVSREPRHEEGGFVCVHGDVVAPREWGYILCDEDAERNFGCFSRRILFCGHSHHASAWRQSGAGSVRGVLVRRLSRLGALEKESVGLKLADGARYIVNVGSVGYPRSDMCIVYCIYDDEAGEVTYRRLPFDFKGYIGAMLAHGHELPLWLAMALRAAAGRPTRGSHLS